MTPFGFFVAAGGVTAILWLKFHHGQIGVSENEFWIGTWLTFLGAIIGAKLSLLFSDGTTTPPANCTSGPTSEPDLSFSAAWRALSSPPPSFAWWRGLSFWQGTDYFAVALPLGHAIGRVGCFVNGCCPGRPPHPVQLYESGGLLAISLVCFVLLKQVERSRLARGTSFCAYLISLRFAQTLFGSFAR